MLKNEEIRSTLLKRDGAGIVRNGAEWLALWSDPNALKTGLERSAGEADARHRLDLAERLSAAARSLSGDPMLQVQLVEGRGQTPAEAGRIQLRLDDLSDAGMPAMRGRVDSVALHRRFHDSAVHKSVAPAKQPARGLFDLLELLRCEALGVMAFPGVGANLLAFQQDRLKRLDLLGAHLASLIPLQEAIRMVVGDALCDRADASVATSGFWMWKRWLETRLLPELRGMHEARADQASYGNAAAAFIAALYRALEGAGEAADRRVLSRRAGGEGDGGDDQGGAQPDASEGGKEKFEPGSDSLEDIDFALPDLLRQMDGQATAEPYRVFTRLHDRVILAQELADQPTLRALKRTLDARRGDYRRDLARLATQLQRRLMARQTRNWTFDLEEGLVDASRLDRVIVNPGFADAYKQEQESSFRDTCVTLLIDNSGSMRGKAIELAAVASDLIASALEQCQVATEVLGFTTSAFRGGRSAKDWAAAGRTVDPGRLNDLLHIVYKSADEPLRRARLNLCAMLKPDLLKENIDGEALIWAARRLSLRPEARRVLIVISDGAPVDEATLNANSDKRILDRHLRGAIADIERANQVQLAAIGLKHEVSDYYRFARRVDRVEDLGEALVSVLDAMVVR